MYKNWEVFELHMEIWKEGELMKSLTMEDQVFFRSDANSLNQALIFSSVFYWKTPGGVLSQEDDALVTLAPSQFESSHLIFHFFPCLWIMNKIIIVCSMKFLPHFPLLMIILFKVYQLENVLCNLNANDSNKCVWGKTQYCVLLLLFLSLEMPSCSPFRGSALYERHN